MTRHNRSLRWWQFMRRLKHRRDVRRREASQFDRYIDSLHASVPVGMSVKQRRRKLSDQHELLTQGPPPLPKEVKL